MSITQHVRDRFREFCDTEISALRAEAKSRGIPDPFVDAAVAREDSIRHRTAEPMIAQIEVMETAMTDAIKQMAELIERLQMALNAMRFFDMVVQSGPTGSVVNLDYESSKQASDWRAETDAWLTSLIESIRKSGDGQGD